jgi:glutathione peroxidase
MTNSVFDFDVETAAGTQQRLANYQAKVLLIVNTASHCGFTDQYQGLESLQQQYGEQGLQVLAFPCNQFGSQEPGSNEEIQHFCQKKFNTTFPVFGKINVNGASSSPLYKHLKQQAPGILKSKAIKWNFTKFLVSRDGLSVQRLAPKDTPESLHDHIRALL